MKTDDLIAGLAARAKPVRRGTVPRMLTGGLLVAVAACLMLLSWWLGMRDMHQAMRDPSWWMKSLYTLALAVGGFLATLRLARPDGAPGKAWMVPVAAVAVLTALAAIELMHTPMAGWRTLFMGHSWRMCPWRILVIAAPVFLLTVWALRRLAPTRLAAAGAAAGLLAGGVGATVYGLRCDETAAAFTLVWYSVGVGVSTLAGALLGPMILAWRR